ncbi:unnamed protein product [Caenorhabditis angaria]|uniref:Uncharacterized protein n=1 Tax=Caenorhabditis angaria TaxID=860376 RepID=A0A9P1I9R9_9PELO|nr:unnamed protein product [Caenorhabditis angaria]
MQKILNKDEISAISQLILKAKNIDSKLVKAVMIKRNWVNCPILEVSGRMGPAEWRRKKVDSVEEIYNKPHVKIRCLNDETKDLDILLSNEAETLYTVEVKAILYGIIWALHNEMRQIQMKNTNEVVVKVANGVYKPSKEKLRFDLIQLFTTTKSAKNGLKMKLERIDETSARLKFAAKLQIEESQFFKKCHKEIENLKDKLKNES